MAIESSTAERFAKVTLATLPVPLKVLATCIIVTLAFGMLGALGQIIVHDIIPTFYSDTGSNGDGPEAGTDLPSAPGSEGDRGDLFADLSIDAPSADSAFYEDEQFVWTLKWTHIHLFGINMIFIFLGLITSLLDAGTILRSWLIALPFIGVLVDVLAMWLKAFVSPAFFWLHVPGGGIFVVIFVYVSLRALWEMWWKKGARRVHR